MKLIWSALARADVRAIDTWLSEHASRETSLWIIAEIRARARFLTEFPQAGRAIANQDFRILRVRSTKYLIAYRLQRDVVEIIRVQHERQNWQEAL